MMSMYDCMSVTESLWHEPTIYFSRIAQLKAALRFGVAPCNTLKEVSVVVFWCSLLVVYGIGLVIMAVSNRSFWPYDAAILDV